MNDMGRRKFEDAFRDAFQDAELTPAEKVWSKVERDLDKTSGDFKAAFLDAELAPTDNVWTNVELDLERAAGEKMRRRLLFYKMLAAASVAFAMCMAGVGYYAYNTRGQGFTARNNEILESNEITSGSDASTNNIADAENSDASKSDNIKSADPSTASNQSSSITNVPANAEANPSAAKEHSGKSSASLLAEKASSENATSGVTSNNRSAGSSVTPRPGFVAKVPAIDENSARVDENRRIKSSSRSLVAATTANATDLKDPNTKSSNSASRIASEYALTGERATNLADGTSVNNANAAKENADDAPVVSAKVLADNDNTHQSQNSGRTQDRYVLSSAQRSASSHIVVANAKVPEKPQSNADPFMLMMLKREDEARAMNAKAKKDSKNSSEQLWTSVGMTAGTYNTVNRSISDDMAASAVRSATSQAKASGLAYSFGLSVGTKLSDRWVVQGGLNYLSQMSDYTSNIIVNNGGAGFNALTASNASVLSDAKLEARDDVGMTFAQTPLFGISSTMEFISIPVEAGYLLVNKKFGVMLNAGVSTDLFIQNTESANVSGAATSVQTQERGSPDSPYRDVNFIGLVGTEVSYKVGQRYRVALTPGLRYPFNSMYKSDSQIQATPVTFDVGLKFRYIFQ